MQDRAYELWHCPPLRAWLSREQCAANRRQVCASGVAKSFSALDDRYGSILRLRECASCSGVEWWAKRTGSRTRTLSSAQLIANHTRDDARRRGMGGDHSAQPNGG